MYKDNNSKAKYGESYIYKEMLKNGIKAKWVAFSNRKNSADFLLSNGKTIDVKYSSPHGYKTKKGEHFYWLFNTHHHGKKQTNIDFYICILQESNQPIIFIFPSYLIVGFQIIISSRTLRLGRYDFFKENWDLLKS